MKTMTLLILTFRATAWGGLLLGALISRAAPVPKPHPRYAEGELLVKFQSGPRGAAAEHTRNRMKHEVKRNFHRLGWQHIRLPKGMTVEEGLAKYRKLPNVLAVEPNDYAELDAPNPPPAAATPSEAGQAFDATPMEQNLLMPASAGLVPNDPRFSAQWNLGLLQMTNAWAVSTGSSNVVVAVLDTGIDYLHEDLRDNMWRNPGETGMDNQGRDKATNGFDDDGDGYVDDVYGIDTVDHDSDPMDLGAGGPRESGFFHGTACAGIIGATGNNGVGMAGELWTVQLMAVRVANTSQTTSIATHLEGVEYLLAMKERGINIRVSNYSYGGPTFRQSYYDAGLRLQQAGIIQVYAGGNGAIDMDLVSRSFAVQDLPEPIVVAALASGSNWGRSIVDLVAPGRNATLTTQPANRYFTDFNGTSAAAPHVTGAAALLAAAKPDATVWEIRAALMHSVDQKPAFTNRVVTHGRLNVGRAMELLTNEALPPIVVSVTPSTSRTRQNQILEVWFSRPMDRPSVEAAFEVNPPVAGSFSWIDDTHFQFLRAEPFLRTNHTARIRGSAMSMAGLTLDGNYNRVSEGPGRDDYVWTFRFAPRNDDFENAQLLAGPSGSVTGNTYNASWQDGEVRCCMTKAAIYPGTLWYQWTPEQDGWITFETSSTLDTMLDALLGVEQTALSLVAENDDHGSRLTSRISFAAVTSTNYSIRVLTLHPNNLAQSMGAFSLGWYPTPPPVVRSFTPTSAYPGQVVTFNGTNLTGATRVHFNGVSASFTNALANNLDLRLTAIVPPDATTGPITIETPHGNFATISNVTVLVPPRLAIQSLPGNRVELSWPLTSGFNLQHRDTLGPTGNWTAATTLTAITNNGQRIVTVSNAAPTRFFRLYRP